MEPNRESVLAVVEQGLCEKLDSYLFIVVGGFSKPREIGGGFAFASGVQTAESDHQVAQCCHISRRFFFANCGPIFAEGDIADVVDWIFDAPVATARGLESGGIQFDSRTGGQDNLNVFSDTNALEMVSGADNDSGLGNVRKTDYFRSDFERINRAGFMPAVSLVQIDVRRKKKGRPRTGKAWRVS